MMENKHLKLNANLIVAALQKPASEFTKVDIIDYIINNDIRMVNFMYPGGDGKLKTLNFVIKRACRWLQLVQFYPGRLERPLCTAPFPYGLCRSLCRDTHRVAALFLFRQGW